MQILKIIAVKYGNIMIHQAFDFCEKKMPYPLFLKRHNFLSVI